MLWAALLFRSLSLDVFARAWSPRDHARPFVVASGGHYPRVVDANRSARDAGIRPGQLISAALALAPDIALRDRMVDAEADALAELATWMLGFTATASIALPDAIVAEIGGSLKLFGGWPRLAARVAAGVRAHGYAAQLGVAPTPTAALLLARAGVADVISHAGGLSDALAPLSLKLLDLDPRTLETLTSAGIETIGDAQRLPRDGLARRFGAMVLDVLDRAHARKPDARLPHVPPARFERRLTLPAPVADTQALGFAVNRLVHELSAWLNARGLGATRLSLALAHERYLRARGMPATIVPFALGAPARASAHLVGVLRERLGRIALPAAVETVTLASDATAPLASRNLGLLPEDEADRGEVPLLDRLRARLGDDAVMLLVPQAEHRPELAETSAKTRVSKRMLARPPVTAPPATQAILPDAPRPVWLLSEPQPVGHLLEAQPWILRDGPERIESGWWDGRDFKRDYFVAENPQGEILWIYRDHRYGTDDGEWFLQGIFA